MANINTGTSASNWCAGSTKNRTFWPRRPSSVETDEVSVSWSWQRPQTYKPTRPKRPVFIDPVLCPIPNHTMSLRKSATNTPECYTISLAIALHRWETCLFSAINQGRLLSKYSLRSLIWYISTRKWNTQATNLNQWKLAITACTCC